MKLSFRLSETGLDGIVQAIRAADASYSIHVFINGDDVEVTSKPMGQGLADEAAGVPAFGGFLDHMNGPNLGCSCCQCVSERVWRGF